MSTALASNDRSSMFKIFRDDNELFVSKRDGEDGYFECMKFIHNHSSFSMSEALANQGINLKK